jgi:hypothetical protein
MEFFPATKEVPIVESVARMRKWGEDVDFDFH